MAGEGGEALLSSLNGSEGKKETKRTKTMRLSAATPTWCFSPVLSGLFSQEESKASNVDVSDEVESRLACWPSFCLKDQLTRVLVGGFSKWR